MFTEDLDIFMADFGSTVICGIVSGLGNFDEPDEDVAGISISSDPSVLVISEKFETVAQRGAAIKVDGADYKVRAFRKIGDGKFAKITLETQ